MPACVCLPMNILPIFSPRKRVLGAVSSIDSQLPIVVLVLPYEILIYTYTLLPFICLEKWKCKEHIKKIWSLVSLEAFLEVAGKGFQNMVLLYSLICGELSLLIQEKKTKTEGRLDYYIQALKYRH